MYASTCNACHAAPDPAHFTANGWISGLNAMSAYYRLSKTEERTLLKYLQNHGKDTGGRWRTLIPDRRKVSLPPHPQNLK